MQRIVTIAMLAGVLCLFIVTPSYSQLKAVQKKVEELESEYEHYLDTGIDNKLSDFNNELRKVLDKLKGEEKAGSIYLQAKIHEKKIQISIKRQEIAPNEVRRITSLSKSIQDARKQLYKTPSNQLQENCDELKTQSNPLNISCDQLQKAITDLEKRVEEAERHIYEYIVPDKAIAQLERYLTQYDYSAFASMKIQSSQGKKAIEQLFDLYTLDGHQSTINQFNNYLNRFPEDHRKLLLQSLSSSPNYKKRQLMASRGEQLLSQPIEHVSLQQYQDYILDAAPTGMAFTALQRLFRQYSVYQRYDVMQEQLSTYEAYFCTDNPLYRSACTRFENLKEGIRNAQELNYSYEWLPLKGDIQKFHPKQQIKLHFSRNYQYITVLPQSEFDPINIFRLDGENTQFVSTAFEKGQLESNFRFSPNPRDNETQILKEQQKQYYLGASCLDSFNQNLFLNSDFFVDEQKGIAFFVSKSQYQRRQIVEETQEFNSIWAIDPNRKLQELGSVNYFNGKRLGNANTDIYYSIKNTGTNTWGCPTHLGPLVNTRYSERSPILQGNKLYFASEGHGSIGGFDIYSVSIIRQGDQLLAIDLKNEIMVNTPADELFFQEAYPSGQLYPNYYIASNKDSKEGYYKLYQLNKRVNSQGGAEPPLPSPSTGRPSRGDFTEDISPESSSKDMSNLGIEITKLDLKILCQTMKNPPPNLGRGRLLLEGTVNVPTDDPDFVKRLSDATVNLSWPGMRNDNPLEFTTDQYGHFSTQVPIRDDRGNTILYWNVIIHKKDQNRVVNFKATIQELSKLCSDANYAYIDYIANETDRNERLGVPYFFEFDKHIVDNEINTGILGNSQQIYQQYAKVFSQDRSNVRFIVVAYADTLGTASDNEWLTGKRAEDVRQQLIKWGIPKDKISTYGFGETTQFSGEIDNLPIIFPSDLTGPGVFNQREKIIHQLNRRAEVIFCSNEYLRDQDCLEHHGLGKRRY